MSWRPGRMKFGAFIAPYHWLEENPTLCMERDMELVELMDRLDFDEAWIGEHHSGGYEIIASPEMFIAALAERTRRIRLGTGVNSLSYHNPLMLANRIVQLDHQTRGRIMFGAGPGQLPSDAAMMGIDPANQRRMMGESLECILDLFDGKTVTRQTDWFHLNRAKLHLPPYQWPRMEVVVASAVTPSGPTTAGRLGLGMLSVAASTTTGFNVLPEHWRMYSEAALAQGHKPERASWRVVVPMHLSTSKAKAREDVKAGVLKSVEYTRAFMGDNAPLLDKIKTADQALDYWENEGLAIFGLLTAGTPDDAIAYIERLIEHSGGFGTLMLQAHNCADWANTKRSYELFARHVMPHFQNVNFARGEALNDATDRANELYGAIRASQEHDKAALPPG